MVNENYLRGDDATPWRWSAVQTKPNGVRFIHVKVDVTRAVCGAMEALIPVEEEASDDA